MQIWSIPPWFVLIFHVECHGDGCFYNESWFVQDRQINVARYVILWNRIASIRKSVALFRPTQKKPSESDKNSDSSLQNRKARSQHCWFPIHYSDVIMGAMAYQITNLTIVFSTIYSGADQSKHQSSASLAFMREIHRWPVDSPHKGPVTRKMFPFDDVIMITWFTTMW